MHMKDGLSENRKFRLLYTLKSLTFGGNLNIFFHRTMSKLVKWYNTMIKKCGICRMTFFTSTILKQYFSDDAYFFSINFWCIYDRNYSHNQHWNESNLGLNLSRNSLIQKQQCRCDILACLHRLAKKRTKTFTACRATTPLIKPFVLGRFHCRCNF